MTETNEPTSTPQSQPSNEKDDLNPFITDSAVCPICETDSPRLHIKSRLYTEQGKDIDLRPLTIRWTNPKIKGFYPQLYFMRHCPKCSYTAANKTFDDPVHDSEIFLSKYIKLWKEAISQDLKGKKIIQRLKQGISQESVDFVQAIKLQLLAIYQLQLIDVIAQKDANDLGRYCLRLAWLFRDIRESNELKKKFGAPITQLLKSLAPDWPGLPANEKVALQMSVDYFLTSLEKSHSVETALDEMNLLLTIARIYVKLENFPEAHKFLLTCTNKVRQQESTAQKQMRLQADEERKEAQRKTVATTKTKKSLDPVAIKKMVDESRKMKYLVDEFKRVFEDCLDNFEKKQTKLAKEILEKVQDRPEDEIEKILLQNKIDKGIVKKLLFNEKKESTGIWKIFKK